MKHTKKLWRVDVGGAGHYILDADGHSVVVFGEPELPLKVITCVNACAGMGPMQPGSVKKFVDAARALRKEYHDIMWNEFSETHDKETDDFDAALAGLGERP